MDIDDVDDIPNQPDMGGYQLTIARGAIRGRFIADPARATPLKPDTPFALTLELPSIAYNVKPGHRLMLHIQSTMFPAFDRNPQSFVPNIFFAEAKDYVKATQRVHRGPVQGSWIDLPIKK
jgi:predicted acyl esterase